MPEPAEKHRFVTATDRAQVVCHESDLTDQRPKDHAAQKRVIGRQHALIPAGQPRPHRRVQIGRFRIVIGICQICIMVMGQMRIAKVDIRHEEVERGENKRLPRPTPCERMAMQNLMLQR